MKRLPLRFFLLCLPLLALSAQARAASHAPACGAVQAAGLSLAERHAAAKASAEAALDPAQLCAEGAVRVMAGPDSDGRPLKLHERREEADDEPVQSGGLPELPVSALAHYAHAAAMVSPATTFAGPFSGFPFLP
ncbi:hypothetical protein [Cupriavidus pinatubonensis]|uniref:hypothetical protein n=1 Tax=Cupriavidus pinatubonensis TaxID=248026 RepID=UPI00112AE3D1|nr:hypothetical protein [Cupriavidus pinatubonensis]TPQ28034.1 hypothetical protein C2U69_33765 [Cupriavidus pinatubonensis]